MSLRLMLGAMILLVEGNDLILVTKSLASDLTFAVAEELSKLTNSYPQNG